jgi:zinc transport system substrate-binding protein
MRHAVTFILFLLCYHLSITMSPDVSAQEAVETSIPVFVSILPQAYFVERVGGDFVEVDVLVGPGQSPATFEPTPQQMARLSDSKLYFTIGVPFEKHLLKRLGVAMAGTKVVETYGATYDLVGFDKAGEHYAYDVGHHDHGDFDPHIWLDPDLAKLQARAICDGLVLTDPANEQYYESNLLGFQADLDSVDAIISKRLALYEGRNFYVFHPAFGHFGKAYGLRQVAIEESGKEPSAKQLADLISKARTDGVKVIVVQEQFSTREAEAVAEAVGARVVRLDPLSRDYLTNLDTIGKVLADALRE